MHVNNILINNKLLQEDERIDLFLRGEMTIDEESEFLQELENNDELKEKAIVRAKLIKGLRQVGSEMDQSLIDELQTLDEDEVKKLAKGQTEETSEKPAKRHPVPTKTIGWISAAASFLIIVWLGIGFSNYQHNVALANKYICNSVFLEDNAQNVHYRSGIGIDSTLNVLFLNIKNKKELKSTIRELSNYWEVSIEETPNDFTGQSAVIGEFLAAGYLKMNEKKKAKEVLEKMQNIRPYSQEDQDIIDKAKDILKQIR